MLLDLGSDVCENLLICLSRRILTLSFTSSRIDFGLWLDLSSFSGLSVFVCCLSFAGSSRYSMNIGEDSVFPIMSLSSSASHEYEGSASMSPDSSWKIIEEVSELSKLLNWLGS